MCVVALALDCHPRWRLVLAANRDEFHARETAPLARWNDAPQVIAGRDLQAGGSWLGVSNDGRLAVLTNIRTGTLPDPAKASRGALVADWLVAGVAPEDDALSGYNPCNLLLVGAEDAALYANHPVSSRTPLDRGLHSLSNGHASEPWPRRRAAEGALSLWLQSGPFGRLAVERHQPHQGKPRTQHHHEIMKALARGDATATRRELEADLSWAWRLLKETVTP